MKHRTPPTAGDTRNLTTTAFTRDRKSVLGAEITVMYCRPDAMPFDSPVILFLHEGLGGIDQWKDFPSVLCAEAQCMGIVYERHGHGSSQRAARRRDLDIFREEALQVVPVLLAEHADMPVVLFGHSDGASIALHFAAAFPARPVCVIALAPHVFVEDRTLDGVRTVAERFRSGDLRQRLSRYHQENTDTMFFAYRDMWLDPANAAWNMFGELPAITCPLLVLQGEDDEYGSERQIREISNRSGGPVETVLIPGCGHAPQFQQRDRVMRESLSFLSKALT